MKSINTCFGYHLEYALCCTRWRSKKAKAGPFTHSILHRAEEPDLPAPYTIAVEEKATKDVVLSFRDLNIIAPTAMLRDLPGTAHRRGRRVAGAELRHLAGQPGGGGE